jgi:bifunctional non-homologous end joining protein LigD
MPPSKQKSNSPSTALDEALIPILQQGTKSPFPANIQPMLATLIDKPFDEPGWIYEVKWDGYRAIAYLNNSTVNLLSRNNKSFNEKF